MLTCGHTEQVKYSDIYLETEYQRVATRFPLGLVGARQKSSKEFREKTERFSFWCERHQCMKRVKQERGLDGGEENRDSLHI